MLTPADLSESDATLFDLGCPQPATQQAAPCSYKYLCGEIPCNNLIFVFTCFKSKFLGMHGIASKLVDRSGRTPNSLVSV